MNFEPYRLQFRTFFPSSKTNFYQVYNASEAFLGIQSDKDDNSMILLPQCGVFYEFIPMKSYCGLQSETIQLDNINLGENYALVISNEAGLRRYIIGDTICFTSKTPFKFKITGRTKQYLDYFSEHIIVDNTDEAIKRACSICSCKIKEYTVCPIKPEKNNK